MDPDADAAFDNNQIAAQILKTTFMTVVFTSCHSYSTETTASVSTVQFSLPDAPVKTIKTVAVKKKKKKTIYLTFDDGPNKGTRKVMHIAEAEKMPITMFIIGEQVYGSREQKETYDSIATNAFIELANHSFTHAHNQYEKFYAVPDSAVKDFIRCADSLHLTYNIIRTPGRNIWRTKNIQSTDIKKSEAAADSLHSEGFTEIGWDLEWHFDKDLKLLGSSDELIQQMDSLFAKGKTKTPDELVLLAHDQVYADPIDSIELHSLIKKLKSADEYNFDVISNYPGIKN